MQYGPYAKDLPSNTRATMNVVLTISDAAVGAGVVATLAIIETHNCSAANRRNFGQIAILSNQFAVANQPQSFALSFSFSAIACAGLEYYVYYAPALIPGTMTLYSTTIVAFPCQPCPLGTYNAASGLLGLSSCLPCPVGQFCNESGLTAGFDCPPGTYCPVTGLTVAVPCPAGSFGTLAGQFNVSSCVSCAAGMSFLLQFFALDGLYS
jgi:hypothetical protein